ncbi:unnamed protein product [Arctia plantaginis]|uniref:Fe2OG dioxygenase domain-containing protein n=1 Tax=Arctia plantaginis TaxID=874455 RepID=A0A8S1AQE6_ARCPL|nr:unnamed protein product [Arctia plantaginis]
MDDEENDPNSPETYQAMCRGDIGVPVQISSRLTCRYLTENHPFLKIAPFKIETVYINPDVIIFHDVLSDGEINSMKELAKPRLSSVSRGGATVFPYLGVSVPPVKGAALFWYNLHSSGEPNHAMLHAGCSVLRGSKWVATKWILQGGQELIKPCNLEYQPEGINDKIPSPMLKETRERKLFEEYKPVPLRQEKRLPQNQEDIEVHDE